MSIFVPSWSSNPNPPNRKVKVTISRPTYGADGVRVEGVNSLPFLALDKNGQPALDGIPYEQESLFLKYNKNDELFSNLDERLKTIASQVTTQSKCISFDLINQDSNQSFVDEFQNLFRHTDTDYENGKLPIKMALVPVFETVVAKRQDEIKNLMFDIFQNDTDAINAFTIRNHAGILMDENLYTDTITYKPSSDLIKIDKNGALV